MIYLYFLLLFHFLIMPTQKYFSDFDLEFISFNYSLLFSFSNFFDIQKQTEQEGCDAKNLFSKNASIFRAQPCVKVGAFSENSSRFSVVNYFRKKLHLRYFTGFWMRLYILFVKFQIHRRVVRSFWGQRRFL